MVDQFYSKNRKVLLQASEDMGGWESIAKAIRAVGATQNNDEYLKVTRQHVLGWATNVKAGVPPEYLEVMEEVTGITREEFRQDIPWRKVA